MKCYSCPNHPHLTPGPAGHCRDRGDCHTQVQCFWCSTSCHTLVQVGKYLCLLLYLQLPYTGISHTICVFIHAPQPFIYDKDKLSMQFYSYAATCHILVQVGVFICVPYTCSSQRVHECIIAGWLSSRHCLLFWQLLHHPPC